MSAGEEVGTTAMKAVEVGKATLEIARHIVNGGPRTEGAVSYAALTARDAAVAGTLYTQRFKTPSLQTQRKIVMFIRNPTTVLSHWVVNPRNIINHCVHHRGDSKRKPKVQQDQIEGFDVEQRSLEAAPCVAEHDLVLSKAADQVRLSQCLYAAGHKRSDWPSASGFTRPKQTKVENSWWRLSSQDPRI
jgi:hypothetical protein